MNKRVLALATIATFIFESYAQQANTIPTPQVHGTLRGKYEYQPEDKKGRFEVRTARVSFDGNVSPVVSYKAEIDLCDEGKIKMLDAYTRIKPFDGFQFTMAKNAYRSPSMHTVLPISNISPIVRSLPNRLETFEMLVLKWAISFGLDFPSTYVPDSSTVLV